MTVSEQSNQAHIDINIIPVDDPPEILSVIQDIQALEDDLPVFVNVSDVFTDLDSDDHEISIQVMNIINPQLIDINLLEQEFEIQFKDNQYGQGQFTVMGISNGLTVSQQVNVVVTPVDDPPYVSQPIDDFSLNEDATSFDIDLWTVFNDIDSDKADFTFLIADNSNPELLSVTLKEEKLMIQVLDNQNGHSTITIVAQADHQHISESFEVQIAAIDDPPTVLNPLDALTLNEDDSAIIFDLSNTFTDIDNDDSDINLSILSVSQPDLLSANILDKHLHIQLTKDQSGLTQLILQADSNHQ